MNKQHRMDCECLRMRHQAAVARIAQVQATVVRSQKIVSSITMTLILLVVAFACAAPFLAGGIAWL